ncbi:MAG: hypothetical protein NVS4B3_20100 [Gemmatimonadaceae bacterium]
MLIMQTTSSRRDGFALAVSLAAIVVIGAIIAGVFFSSTQEVKAGRNAINEARAFAIAEWGLNAPQSGWIKKTNLTMNVGDTARKDTTYNLSTATDSAVAHVITTRLNKSTYWVVSEGAYMPTGNANSVAMSVKRTNAILRTRYPSVNIQGAITTNGNISVTGAAQVSGINSNPFNWAGCGPLAASTAGVAIPLTGTASTSGAATITGTPPVLLTPTAASSSTYITYGDENWNSLVAQRNITIPTSPYGNGVAPTLDASGNCDLANTANWGEPWRPTATVVPPCYNYFPIIYSPGSLTLNSNGRGQGILIVNGSLTFNGAFQFYGLILVRDDIVRGAGAAVLYGAVMAQNASLGSTSSLSGTTLYQYSQCAVASALQGSASVIQAKQRGWAQLY